MDQQQRNDRLIGLLFGVVLLCFFIALLFIVKQIMGPIPIRDRDPVTMDISGITGEHFMARY